MDVRGRFPFARPLRSPALTRSTISERSSCATAPRTVKATLPAGVLVSICSPRLTKAIPRELNVSTARSKCETERANRSPDDHHVELPAVRVGHEAIEPRPLFRRAADADVHVTVSHSPSAAFAVLCEVPNLHFRALAVVRCADSCVQGGSHRGLRALGLHERFACQTFEVKSLSLVLRPFVTQKVLDNTQARARCESPGGSAAFNASRRPRW